MDLRHFYNLLLHINIHKIQPKYYYIECDNINRSVLTKKISALLKNMPANSELIIAIIGTYTYKNGFSSNFTVTKYQILNKNDLKNIVNIQYNDLKDCEERYRNELDEDMVVTYKIKYSYYKINDSEIKQSNILWFLDPIHVRKIITYLTDRLKNDNKQKIIQLLIKILKS